MKQTILLMCLSLSLFMSCNNDHETDLLSTKSQDEVKTLSFLYHDTLYTSSYTGDLNTNARIVDERVKSIYDEIQSREELAFIENKDGVIEYFDNSEKALDAARLSLANNISSRSTGRGEPSTLPAGTSKVQSREGDRIWTILTTIDTNNSNKYYVKVVGNDATKRRVARGDGGYIYPRNNKDRPEAKIGNEVPPFSSYVEVYEYIYSFIENTGSVKSIILDYSVGGMMYNEIAGQKKYAELYTEITSANHSFTSNRGSSPTTYTRTTYTLKTWIYNFLQGGGTRFTGFYPFTKENATIAYWIEYVPEEGATSGSGRRPS